METQKSPKTKEFDFFLKTPLKKYKGKYVVIIGNKVVASGENAKEVWLKARKKYPKKLPTLAKLPKEEALVLKFYGNRIRFSERRKHSFRANFSSSGPFNFD